MRKVILSLALLAIGYMNLDKVKSMETVVEDKSKLRLIAEAIPPKKIIWCGIKDKKECKNHCASILKIFCCCKVKYGYPACKCK